MAAFAIEADGIPLASVEGTLDMTSDVLGRNNRKAVMAAVGIKAHEGHHPFAATSILRDVGHRLVIGDGRLVAA